MHTRTHEAKYYEYCEKCKYQRVVETDDPCNECLTQPVNVDSRRPIRFEEAK